MPQLFCTLTELSQLCEPGGTNNTCLHWNIYTKALFPHFAIDLCPVPEIRDWVKAHFSLAVKAFRQKKELNLQLPCSEWKSVLAAKKGTAVLWLKAPNILLRKSPCKLDQGRNSYTSRSLSIINLNSSQSKKCGGKKVQSKELEEYRTEGKEKIWSEHKGHNEEGRIWGEAMAGLYGI